MQLSYGSGALYGERIDIAGVGPQQFGILQSSDISFDFTVKELYGKFQFPVAIARGTGKVTGKAKFAQIIGALWSDIFLGVPVTTGSAIVLSQAEPQAVPTATPFTVTVDNATTFDSDLGVVYAMSGEPFNKTAAAPTAAGEYSVDATGEYTFDLADADAAVLITYSYLTAATVGKIMTVTNQLLGHTPAFKSTFYQEISPSPPGGTLQFRPMSLRLNACTSSKLDLPTTLDNFTMQDFDFQAFADASNTVGYFSTTE